MSSFRGKVLAALRRSVAALRGLISTRAVSPMPAANLLVGSPRLRRVIEELGASGARRARGSRSGGDRRQPLGYCIRPELVACRVRPGFDAVDVPPAVRFSVTGADSALLGFLQKAAPGFHVFELSCAGLETLWRDDLAKVLESRSPMAGRMTVFHGSGQAEFEHVAVPVLEGGRCVAIRGWFDQIDGTEGPMAIIDWSGVRCVRRSQRTQPFALPARCMRPEAHLPAVDGAGVGPGARRPGAGLPRSGASSICA